MDNHFDFLFKNPNIDVSFDGNGVAWFQGLQVASMLGHKCASNMYRMLSPDETSIRKVDLESADGTVESREIVMINEYGLYRLIAMTKTPEAAQFQNWLFGIALPCVRRYGAYIDEQTGQALEASLRKPVVPQMMTSPVPPIAPAPDTDSENESASTTAVSEQETNANTVE